MFDRKRRDAKSKQRPDIALIAFRCSPKEHAYIKRSADKLGMTISDFIRDLVKQALYSKKRK